MDALVKRWKRAGLRFRYATDLDMKKKTTLGVGGRCEVALFPLDRIALGAMSNGGVPVFGAGSNVVVGDGGMGACAFTERMNGIYLAGRTLKAECGASISRIARVTAECGYSGFEQLSGIPGTVGGAIKMNAGCFGREIADLITSVDIATKEGIRTFTCDEMGFSYKESKVKELGAVVSATFRLTPCDPACAKATIAELKAERERRFPKGRSAGCYFKRVDGVSAGYFVEKAGLKGLKIGGAEVSATHGAFIVNTGGATAYDVTTLAEIVKEEVRRVTGVTLAEEVDLYGRF